MKTPKEVAADQHTVCHNPCSTCNKTGLLENGEPCTVCGGSGCQDHKSCSPAGGLGCNTED